MLAGINSLRSQPAPAKNSRPAKPSSAGAQQRPPAQMLSPTRLLPGPEPAPSQLLSQAQLRGLLQAGGAMQGQGFSFPAQQPFQQLSLPAWGSHPLQGATSAAAGAQQRPPIQLMYPFPSPAAPAAQLLPPPAQAHPQGIPLAQLMGPQPNSMPVAPQLLPTPAWGQGHTAALPQLAQVPGPSSYSQPAAQQPCQLRSAPAQSFLQGPPATAGGSQLPANTSCPQPAAQVPNLLPLGGLADGFVPYMVPRSSQAAGAAATPSSAAEGQLSPGGRSLLMQRLLQQQDGASFRGRACLAWAGCTVGRGAQADVCQVLLSDCLAPTLLASAGACPS